MMHYCNSPYCQFFRRLLAGLIMSGILCMPTIVNAEGIYLGASAGSTEDQDSAAGLRSRGFVGEVDDEDSGFKLFIGKKFNSSFAIEGGYVDLGEFSATASGGTASIKAEVDGFHATAVGSYPIGENFSVIGRVGVWRWDGDAIAIVAGTATSIDEDGVDSVYGVGAQFNVTKKIGLRAEWERFEVDNDGVDLLSAGVVIYLQ